jgi:DNA primase
MATVTRAAPDAQQTQDLPLPGAPGAGPPDAADPVGWVDPEALKRAHPVAGVVARCGGAQRRSGRALVGRCPFHPDGGRPNLYVYPETDSWWCYRCDVGGDALDFLALLEGLDFLGAAARLAKLPAEPATGPGASRLRGAHHLPETPPLARAAAPGEAPPPGRSAAGGTSPEEHACLAAAVEVYHRRLLADARALAYVAGRGVDPPTLRRFRVGYAAGELAAELRRRGLPLEAAQDVGLLTRSGREFLRGRVVVPEVRDGRPVWLVGRALDAAGAARAKYLGLPGRKPLLGWEAALAAGAPEVCLVEGPFDALVLAAWGVPALALVGTHARAEALRELERFERIYVVLDADAAGREGTAALRAALGDRALPVSLAGLRGAKDVADLAALPNGRALFDGRLRAARRIAALGAGTRPAPGRPPGPSAPSVPATAPAERSRR